MASDSEIAAVCRANGYKIEYVKNFDSTEDMSTLVVEFPCKFPMGTKLAEQMSAVDQLNVIKRLQSEWSDNSVSVTIYYRKTELSEIKEWLASNYNTVKSVSFLLHNDHGFVQAPLEEITKEQYEEISSRVFPIHGLSSVQFSDLDINECDTGACPIR
jgi:hypothetical protein